jgi:hypothetical protein
VSGGGVPFDAATGSLCGRWRSRSLRRRCATRRAPPWRRRARRYRQRYRRGGCQSRRRVGGCRTCAEGTQHHGFTPPEHPGRPLVQRCEAYLSSQRPVPGDCVSSSYSPKARRARRRATWGDTYAASRRQLSAQRRPPSRRNWAVAAAPFSATLGGPTKETRRPSHDAGGLERRRPNCAVIRPGAGACVDANAQATPGGETRGPEARRRPHLVAGSAWRQGAYATRSRITAGVG